jgi:acid phosphatase
MKIICYAVGDTGSNTHIRQMISERMNKQPCEFLLLMGDNFYPRGVGSHLDSKWITEYESMFGKMKTYAILGNHDYMSDPVAQILYSTRIERKTNWNMPFLFYDKVIGDAHFFFIDTMIMAPKETAGVTNGVFNYYKNIDAWINKQLVWLERELRKSKSCWKIVVGHYPIYSGGIHGDTVELQQSLLPILVDHGVHMYLSGHDHCMQHIHRNGIHFIVAGSGSMLHPCTTINGTVYFSSRGGFCRLEIHNDRIITAFISADTGQILHQHILIQ